jgi:uncharacterized membrane-anchored protein YhcB (DUF1043 family)
MSEVIADFIVALLGIVLGVGVTALVAMARLKPELKKLQAEAEKLKAETEQSREARKVAEAEVMVKITEAMENLIGPLNTEITLLRSGREDDRDRIRNLEKIAGEQGQSLIGKDVALEQLRNEKDREISKLTARIEEMQKEHERETYDLRCQIELLKQLVDDYRSGRKKPTGPLGLGQ